MCRMHHAVWSPPRRAGPGPARHGPARRAVLRGAGALAASVALGVAPRVAFGRPVSLPAPGPRDVCPVCGMFVAPYRYWIATVLFKDGTAAHFDGAKDFFKYLHDLKKYAPQRAPADIRAMGVTDYYGTARIDAREAWYVLGSDVLGPMGHELVPLDSEADAKEFLTDHKGRRIVRFGDVQPGWLGALDEGRFP